MLRMLIRTLPLLLTLTAAPARTPDDVRTLTGGSQREWLYGGTTPYQTGGECKGGATWTFSSSDGFSGRLTKKVCRNRRFEVEGEHTWRVWTKASGVSAITLDENTVYKRSYEMRFLDTGSKRLKMTLTWTEGTKSDGFEEMEFNYIPKGN